MLFDLCGCGRSSRTAPVGSLPASALQPDLLADDVAALIGHYGAQRADVLGFSCGGGIVIRVAGQHPDVARRLVLASTTAYPDQPAADDGQRQGRPRPVIAWDDPELTGPGAPDGALSRAMAHVGAPADIWRHDRLEDRHRVLARVAFSSDWNLPHARGQLRPGCPAGAEAVLRDWGGPVLILPASRTRPTRSATPADSTPQSQQAPSRRYRTPRTWPTSTATGPGSWGSAASSRP